MHCWGDNWPHWGTLNEAVEFIPRWTRLLGRLGGDAKEKFGTLRFYVHFHHAGIHDLIYPGYVYIQFSKGSLLWNLEMWLQRHEPRWLTSGICWWQIKVYRLVYRIAVWRWPDIRQEILMDADYSEYLEDL